MYILANHPDFPGSYESTKHSTIQRAKCAAEVETALNRSRPCSHVDWEVRLEGYSDEYIAGWTILKITPEWTIIKSTAN